MTYDEKLVIKPKFGKIRQFLWSKNDDFIITCSNTGSVCIWDADNGDKLNEYVSKTNNLLSLAMFHKKFEMENLYVLDNRNEIKELKIVLNKNLPVKGEDILETDLISPNFKNSFSSICCDMFGYMLLIGDSGGKIHVKPSKIEETSEFNGHNDKIIFLRFTCDNNFLISCSVDGTLIVWSVTSSFSFAESKKRNLSNEVLIAKGDLQLQNYEQMLKKGQLEEENEVIDYDLKLKEMSNNEKFNLIDYNCKLDLSSMRSLLKELKIINDSKVKEFEMKIDHISKMFENDLNAIRETSEKDLIKKFNEYDALDKIYKDLLETKEIIINESNEIDEKDIEVENRYRVQEANKKHKQEIEKLEYEIRLIQEENTQIEIEGDDEIENLKKLFKSKINFYEKDNQNLMLDVCFMRKKLINDEEKLRNLNLKRDSFNEILSYKQLKLIELENRIEKLKLQADESDKILVSKDEKCFKIKLKNQNLEKHRFINEYQIVQYQNLINPLKEENENLKVDVIELERKSSEIRSKINRIKSLNENFQIDLQKIRKTVTRVKNNFNKTKKVENRILNIINHLKSISNKDEAFIEKEFENIISKLPDSIKNEINIDLNAIVEIDKQMSRLRKTIKTQNKKTIKFQNKSKDNIQLNIKENLSTFKSFQIIQKNRKELEFKFKSMLKKLKIKISSASEMIDYFDNILNIYK